MDMKSIHIVSAAIGEGAPDGGCKYGGNALLASGIARALTNAGRSVQAQSTVTADALSAQDRMDAVVQFSHELAATVARVVQDGSQPLVLGGDHSCAIGTWSGIAQALAPENLGLIWVDAHLDAHTPDSSVSKAPHGMPVAALLGHGSAQLTDIFGWCGKIQPANLVIIGARSYEAAERSLLERLGVKVIYMAEVAQRGFQACFTEAIAHVSANCARWGLSFDLDGLDPHDVPATGTPVDNGIRLDQATAALQMCRDDPRFIGLEITEYNPVKDFGGKSAQAVHALAVASLGAAASHDLAA